MSIGADEPIIFPRTSFSGEPSLRLGDLLAEPEQFAGTSLTSIERSFALEAETQRVTDGICRPGELSDDIKLVGHVKWLNSRVTAIEDAPRILRNKNRDFRYPSLLFHTP